MPVATVGADDVVVGPEVGTRGGRHRLLTDVRMRGALDQTLQEELRRPLVEAANLDHRRVEALELLDLELHGVLRGAHYIPASRSAGPARWHLACSIQATRRAASCSACCRPCSSRSRSRFPPSPRSGPRPA